MALAKVQETHYQEYLHQANQNLDLKMVPNAVPGVEYEFRVQEIVEELRSEDLATALLEEKKGKLETGEAEQLEQEKQLVEVTMVMDEEL